MNVRIVESIADFERILGLARCGVLLEDDLDVVENDTELNNRKRRDAEVLCTLAANSRTDVLELGTSHGRGAFKLATNLPPLLRCHTVNILPDQHDSSGGKMVTHLIPQNDIGSYYRERGVGNVVQYFANTARWSIPPEIRDLGMVFVDAAHDEENVYQDSKLVWDRIAPGGFIVWHDFSQLSRHFDWINASMRGVERFLREYGLESLEVLNLRHSWCGVLRKPAGIEPITGSAGPRITVTHPTPPLTSVGVDLPMRSLRYAIVYPSYSEARDQEEALMAESLTQLGYSVEAIGIPCPGGWWHFPKLDQLWREQSKGLIEAYERLELKLRNKDVLIASGGAMLHPEFLKNLSTFNVLICADDPESSDVLSRPIAPSFDYSFPMNIGCVEDYRRWGCKQVDWLFHPIRPELSAPELTEQSILEGNRTLDISILCERIFNLSDRGQRIERLVKTFPNAFVRGPGWPHGPIPAPGVYRDTKIGWNLHNSTGPCNTRSTMLPAFGVMQVCDNASHFAKLFQLDKEGVGFDSLEECIDKTRYYLEHDQERRRIAVAGWKRATQDYTLDRWWERVLSRITAHVTEKTKNNQGDHLFSSTAGVTNIADPSLAGPEIGNTTTTRQRERVGQRSDGKKPRILMLVDRRGWAYDTAAKSISVRLSDEFEFHIAYVRENPDLNAWEFDLLYVFFWGETYHHRFGIPPERIVKEISSHRWANEESYGLLTPTQMAAKYLFDAGTLTATSKRLQAIFDPIRPTQWCPNGFEPGLFAPPDSKSGPLKIGWAGNRRDPCKGLQDILEPAAGEDFELLIAGGDLDTKAMARFYRSIDVLCIASTAEGEPLTLIEGMAAGVFPVAVDVGIVPELVRHRENGLIIERKPSAFRAAFQWCRLNPDKVRSAGASNARSMASIRGWDNVAPHWREVLRAAWEALSTKSHPPFTPSVDKPSDTMSNPKVAESGHASTAAASMKELKSGYFDHLKAMNPAGAQEATYQASLFYYRGELDPLLPESRQARCLDIGCGFGHLPRFLLERGFRRVGGIEIDARLHAEAKTYVGERMEFLELGDAIPFLEDKNDSFDFITLFDVIEHFTLDDGVALSRGILKSLRPGGRVIMRTPNMANIFGSYSRHMDLTHQIGFTEQSLSQMLRLAGFSDVGVHVPQWDPKHPLTRGLTESADFHRRLFGLQDRSTPRSFEKNIVVWARR